MKTKTISEEKRNVVATIASRRSDIVYSIVYTLIAVLIVKDDIGRVPALMYVTFIVLGLIFLRLGISGVIDKRLTTKYARMTSSEARFWGYILMVASIGVLMMLYFREAIFS